MRRVFRGSILKVRFNYLKTIRVVYSYKLILRSLLPFKLLMLRFDLSSLWSQAVVGTTPGAQLPMVFDPALLQR